MTTEARSVTEAANSEEQREDAAGEADRLRSELRRCRTQLDVIQRVSGAADSRADFMDAVALTVTEVARALGWPVGHAWLRRDSGRLTPGHAWYLESPDRHRALRDATEAIEEDRESGLVAQVVKDAHAIWNADVSGDPYHVPRTSDVAVRAALLFPVTVGSSVEGVLEFYTTEAVAADAEWLRTAEHLGSQLGRILERDRAARELRRSLRLLDIVAEGIPDALFVKDSEGRYEMVNRAAADRWGVSREAFLGSTDAEVLGEERAEPLRARDLEVMRTGRTVSYHMDFDRGSGRVDHMLVTKGPLREGGEVTGVFGIVRDITSLKDAERELRNSQKNLSERLKEMNTLYGVMKALARDQDPLGQRLSEAVRLIPSGLCYPELAVARIVLEDEEYVSGAFRPVGGSLSAAIVPHGSAVGRVELCYTETPPAGGDPFLNEERLLLEAIAQHVGEAVWRGRLEHQLVHAQKMEAVGRLAGGIAHDFNNLLTGIGGLAHLMLMDTPEEDPRHRDLSEILASTERATGLTRQLLAFSRKQVVRPVDLNPNQLLERFRSMLGRLIGEDVQLRLELASEPLHVYMDETQLEQAVMNLVVNARDAMPAGGSITVRTSGTRLEGEDASSRELTEGEYVLIEVADTGSGMDERTLEQIFDPFFTTKPQGKGTGLGLSTVYGIVTQAGGTIEVDSKPSEGTRFRLFLPSGPQPDAPGEARPGAGRVGAGVVLVVDDDDTVRQFVGRALERGGYRPRLVARPEDAIGMLEREERVAALVTDIVMPGWTGIQLMERARELRSDLPVLLMSGYFEQADQLDTGPDTIFLRKPFTPDSLLARLNDLIN